MFDKMQKGKSKRAMCIQMLSTDNIRNDKMITIIYKLAMLASAEALETLEHKMNIYRSCFL